MILVIREKVTPEQLSAMLEAHSKASYVKFAVDVKQEFVAGGGFMHADCEEVLLELGCEQSDVWGAGWHWNTKEVTFDSLINIRPKQGNRQIELQIPELRQKISTIILELFGGVEP